jgi:CheY-like chemotaxis protein
LFLTKKQLYANNHCFKRQFNTENLELLKDKKILLCEDKSINVLIIKKILSSIGIKTDVAENGFEGLHKVKNNHYDLILMDIRMPVMDGLTATKKIRLFNKTTPIIALSANAHQEDIEKSINSGMNSHLSKPIEKQKLFETLVKYII